MATDKVLLLKNLGVTFITPAETSISTNTEPKVLDPFVPVVSNPVPQSEDKSGDASSGGAKGDGSFGIAVFAYNWDPVKCAEYVEKARYAAYSAKWSNPTIPVALMTNLAGVKTEWPFDKVVIFSSDFIPVKVRQWWTRIRLLNSTPWDRTLQVDADRSVCGDVSEVFKYLETYDFLNTANGILPLFDNGVFGYRKGPKFQQLIDAWLEVHVVDEEHKIDDQTTLSKARTKVPGIRMGVLPPHWQIKAVPARGEPLANTRKSHTLPFWSEPKVILANPPTKEHWAESCSTWWAFSNTTRQVVWWTVPAKPETPGWRYIIDGSDYRVIWKTVFSDLECQQTLNVSTCSWRLGTDWAEKFEVMGMQDYLRKYAHQTYGMEELAV